MTGRVQQVAVLRGTSDGAEWLWLVPGGVSPQPGALETLLERAAAATSLAIVAGMVVDEAGQPAERLLPHAPETEPALVFAAAQERWMPIRWSPLAHALIRADLVERFGLPRTERLGPFAAVEWSARVLRVETGAFVPAARATLADTGPAAPDPSALAAGLRFARTQTVTRGEAARLVVSAVRGR